MNEVEGLRQRRLPRPQVITDDSPAQEAKEGSTYSSKVFRVTFLTLAASLTVPLLGVTVLLDCPIDPQPISLKEPPLLTGVLEPNIKLRKAERLWENQLYGPESIVNIGDILFTGTADGKIIKIEDGEIQTISRIGHGPCGTHEDEPTCGRPLGIRVGPNSTLFVADAYYGLYEVDPDTGETKMLVSTKTVIEGQKLSFVNDLTVTRDGRKIYFTDSSSKWQRRDYLFLIMEGTDDGRLLEYDTVTKEVKVLMVGLRFPNGVQLSPAEDFVLVQETTMARIRRYYVSGLMKGGADMFVENMPGLPDNIRLSSSGGYWVAMAAVRHNPGFSLLDFLAGKPWIKKMIFKERNGTVSTLVMQQHRIYIWICEDFTFVPEVPKILIARCLRSVWEVWPVLMTTLLSQETVTNFVPKYSLVVELTETGSYRRSFHDPNGVMVAYVSEAHEHNGYLYLGSFRSPYICRINLQHV
ncbi:PREDICTED: adipocyte plasma membrane-associated protein isoform X1 [Lepidothrix coronata]|uniref:Adipocyte plasma membrane-associated protein n=1 Tax=Lepidothrix coronata TaxID=321398 RepID=A0A6J0IW06_9PASS|nr:PREDICTED: adipocyte plasma membrane-associated protein isoform X1 [Lepidothrix coronata]